MAEEETLKDVVMILMFALRYCAAHNMEPLPIDEAINTMPPLEEDAKLIRQLAPQEMEMLLISGALGTTLMNAANRKSKEFHVYNPMNAIKELLEAAVYASVYYTHFRGATEIPPVGIRRYQGQLWYVERQPNKQEKLNSLLKQVHDVITGG